MKYLLDTNICIYLIRRRPAVAHERFLTMKAGDIGISSITLAELQFGVAKSQHSEKNRVALEAFVLPLEIVAFDAVAAAAYGPLRAVLERHGRPIGPLDLLIAAQALSLRATLVTNNSREFDRVPGLQCQNWALPSPLQP